MAASRGWATCGWPPLTNQAARVGVAEVNESFCLSLFFPSFSFHI